MKTELLTAIGAAIAGALIAFFVTNIFLTPIEDFKITTIQGNISTDLTDPNVDVFNYRALNPTVEVYVGDDCQNPGENGECLDTGSTDQENR